MDPFKELLPDLIMEAVSRQGMRATGVLYQLNSYENRVYLIHLEESDPIVGKFYRPQRWDEAAIADEHRFVRSLAESQIPVVAPLALRAHAASAPTLDRIGNFLYAFFPKFRGREHDEITNVDRAWLGRTLGRMHRLGESFSAPARPSLDPESYGYASLDYIMRQTFIPCDLREYLGSLLEECLARVEPFFDLPTLSIPLHGDCHPGNILWNHDGPCLVDFDDMVIAPPVQDVWMLFSGDEAEQESQKDAFFDAYETFREFDYESLILAEPLRSLRMIRHAAWIGQRYDEPAFQRAFPYYQDRRYWEEFLLAIKEQIALLQEMGA